MNRIPKCKTKLIVFPQQPHYLKVNKKEITKEGNISNKITQKRLKFNNSRQFGKDITIAIKNISKEESKKLATTSIITDKVIIYKIILNLQNQIYIKKHSPASQVIQNQNCKTKIDVTKQIKIYINKSGMIKKRKSSVITLKNKVNYENNENKQPQFKHIDSFLKNSCNDTKLSNSNLISNNIHQNSGNVNNCKIKNNILYHNIKNTDINLSELNYTSINLL